MAQFNAFFKAGKGSFLSALAAIALLLVASPAQSQLLADNFNRTNSGVLGNGWAELETVSPNSVRVQSNQLRMSSSTEGRDRASKVTPGTYLHTLDSNRFVMEWSFNLRQSIVDPTGFGNGRIGAAVALASSVADLMTGFGYAVVLGQAGTVDPIRLVRYTGGLSSDMALTDLISAGDFGREHLAVRVTYDPVSGQWAMFYTETGETGPFADPLAANTSAGTAVDRTYTADLLPYIGCFYNHRNSATAVAVFDNIHAPQDNSTSVFFSPITSESISSEAGTHAIMVGINNPNPFDPVFVDVFLQSGDPATLQGWTFETIKFEPGSSDPVALTLPIREYGGCGGDDELVFQFQNLTGGIGSAYFGIADTYTLEVQDRSNGILLLEESFETDGNGSRYVQSIATGTGGGGYFLRGDAATFAATGSPAPSDMDGTSLFGALRLNSLATNSEASVLFTNIDIVGVSELTVDLRLGARNANEFDNAVSIRDHLYVETNIDGAGWTTVGAFRSTAPGSLNSRPMAQDTDFDGVGDGNVLKPALRRFALPVAGTGQQMDVRIRFRTNDAKEELYFDRVRVRGSLCSPVYYSTSSGSLSDPIWSDYRTGVPATAVFDRHANIVLQTGHNVTNTSTLDLNSLKIESTAEFQMASTIIAIHGTQLEVDGLLRGGQGTLRLRSAEPMVLLGSGTYNLFNLTVDAPAGVTADALVDIRGTLQLDNGTFHAIDRVRLRSSSNGTGRLGRVPATADYVGDLTVQRHIPAGATNWRLMGSPVGATTVADWNDNFITTGFPGSNFPNFDSPVGSGIPWASVRTYDETLVSPDLNVGLIGVTGVGHALVAGQGFAIWSGTSSSGTNAFVVDVTGPPHIARSPISMPLTYTNTGNAAADGWNLVSNPLASPIAFTALARGADVQNAYWIFNPATGNNASWSGGFGTNGANGTIHSSQAFWLRTLGSDISASVTENAKVNVLVGGTFGGQEQPYAPLVRLGIRSAINEFSDETLVVFAQGTPGRSADEGDADKMLFGHPAAPRIATLAPAGIPMAISMYGPIATDIIIPVMVQVGVSGTYTVSVDEFISPGVLSCVSLEDLVTGAVVPLAEGATYSLDIEAGTDPTQARFLIHATASMQLSTNDVACAGANTGNAVLVVEEGPVDLLWTDNVGTVIQSHTALPAGEVELNDLAPGIYTIQLSSNTLCGTLSHTFTISAPFAMEVQPILSAASCSEISDGGIVLEVLGGVAPYDFAWSNGSTSQSLEEVAPGIYGVEVTDANGCTITVDQLVIEATSTIAGDVIAPASGAPATLIAFSSTADAGTAHFWNFGDGATSTAQFAEHSYSIPGQYTVSLELSRNGCTLTKEHSISVALATGIADTQLEGMGAWHNGNAIVLTNSAGLGGEVRVLDALGRLVASAPMVSGTERIEVPTQAWPTGIYHLQFNSGANRWMISLPVGY